MKEFFPVP